MVSSLLWVCGVDGTALNNRFIMQRSETNRKSADSTDTIGHGNYGSPSIITYWVVRTFST